MKILITSFTFPPQANGVAHVVEAHATGLARLGYEVTVATGYDPNRNFDIYGPGVRVIQFKASGNANLRVGFKGEIDRYENFIANSDCDVIICHGWQIWTTDIAIRVLGRIKTKILFSHSISANNTCGFPRTFLTWLAWRPYVWKMPNMLREFDHITFLTDRMNYDQFYDRLFCHRLGIKNFTIIPNGADPQSFDLDDPDFRKIFPIGQKRMILCVAGYSPMKNQEMALKAYLKAEPSNSILVFIGGELNSYAHKLKRLYDSRRLKKQESPDVLFLEKQEQHMIRAAYRSADLFLNPSRSEGQPLVLLDAMASATPFISTNVGCVAELPGGVVVNSEAEMANQIVALLDNPQERNRLAAEGLHACRSTYNWERIVMQLDTLIRKLTGIDYPGKVLRASNGDLN